MEGSDFHEEGRWSGDTLASAILLWNSQDKRSDVVQIQDRSFACEVHDAGLFVSGGKARDLGFFVRCCGRVPSPSHLGCSEPKRPNLGVYHQLARGKIEATCRACLSVGTRPKCHSKEHENAAGGFTEEHKTHKVMNGPLEHRPEVKC